MKKILTFLFLVYCYGAGISQKITYSISFPNIAHHEASIAVEISGSMQENFMFRMSRSSPGRYATHEFGKNVYNVSAVDKAGKALTVNRPEGDIYNVQGQHDYVKLRYTLYGNHSDGTYADIDESAVLMNIPACFMWVKGFEKVPVDVHFDLPAGKNWTIATQLKPAADSASFTAPDLQYFMDCPVLIGDLKWKEWTIKNPDGKAYRIRLALNANADDSMATEFAEKLQRLTVEQQAVFGEMPAFDFGTYTFLASIHPYVRGDGMEHRNSTMITEPYAFDGSNRLLGTFSHEFFHCWNVERIRPATLEPFNFEKSNISNALWVAEGFTQYYGELLMARSGLGSVEHFTDNIALWINAKTNTPAGKNYSPVDMSNKAVFTDAGVSIDRNNNGNTFISYYNYGASIALALDLELRSKFNLTLDSFMVIAWKKFGKTGVPYTVTDMQELLQQVTGHKSFADGFFSSYVYGHEPFDYASVLGKAGYQLKKAFEGVAWWGDVGFTESAGGLVISSNTLIGTPLYIAGLDFNDRLISIDGIQMKTTSDLRKLLLDYKPGDAITVNYIHRVENKTTKIVLGESPLLMLVPNEKLKLPVTPQMISFRENWLNSKLPKGAM